MNTAYFLHNPRCSKSREALALVKDKNSDIEVVEYLKSPLGYGQLERVAKALNVETKAMLRTKEAEFKALKKDANSLSNKEILSLIAQKPKLLERPILVIDGQARIGRPPEAILELLD